MHIYKCSASSLQSYSYCPFQYYLNYCLGIDSPPIKSGVVGTIVHEVLKDIALLKKRNKQLPVNWLIDRELDYGIKKNPHITLGNSDIDKIRSCINIVLKSDLNPGKLNVIQAEQKFNINMSGDEWRIVNKDSVSQFAVRGIFDLIHKIDDDTIEVLDWKTGKRQNFNTFQSYDFYDLMCSIQPRLYHFAALYLFPQYKNIIVTFDYILDGGPVRLPFSADDAVYTIAFLKNMFDTIKQDCTMIRNRNWKCNKFCHYGKTGLCDEVYADLMTFGQQYVELQWANK